MPSEELQDDVDRNPGARRTYRLLGIVHGLLFGGVVGFRAGIESGIIIGIVAGFLIGGVFLGVFWKLGNDHYTGNVPGEPGNLVYKGETDDVR